MDEYERFHYQCAIGHNDLDIIKKDRNMCCKYKNVENNFPSKLNHIIEIFTRRRFISSVKFIMIYIYIYTFLFLVYKIAILFIPQSRIPTQDENIQLIYIQYLSCHLHFSKPFSKFIINDWDDLLLYFLMLEVTTQTRCLWIMCI